MSNDEALIAALRAAGHEQVADALRDKALAGELREAGHDGLAAVLEGTQTSPGFDVGALQDARQAEVRELAEWASAQANGQPTEVAPTLQQLAMGLRSNETVRDGQIVPIDEREDK